jgi:hypothetical protein
MDHPKFILKFDPKHPSCPFLIREYSLIDGKIASRPYESFSKLKEALTSLANATGEEVIVAVSAGSIDNKFTV